MLVEVDVIMSSTDPLNILDKRPDLVRLAHQNGGWKIVEFGWTRWRYSWTPEKKSTSELENEKEEPCEQ